MEVLLALMARADHEYPLGRLDVKAQDAAACAERDDELTQRRPGTGLAVALRLCRQVAQRSLSYELERLVGHGEIFGRFCTI